MALNYALVNHLLSLQKSQMRGSLAELRRGLGKSPGTAASMFPHVAPFVPDQAVRSHTDAPYYVIAALFATHLKHTDSQATLGTGLKQMGVSKSGEQPPSNELRFRALLRATGVNAPQHLQRIVGMFRSREISLNYHVLLQHLLHWDHPERWVQRRLALDFWASQDLPVDPAVEI